MKKERVEAYLIIQLLAAVIIAGLVIPVPRFEKPVATVIQSTEGRLLDAHIASDGQWRFPQADSVNYKYRIALVNYEDRYF